MGMRRSALGGGALSNYDRDLVGLGSAEHGQLDAVTRFGAANAAMSSSAVAVSRPLNA